MSTAGINNLVSFVEMKILEIEQGEAVATLAQDLISLASQLA